jgi:hypothetical protein
MRVNYTHNFFSAMLLKTGLIGMALAVVYIAGLFTSLGRLVRAVLILTLAIAGPLLIDVILYASYKWLDFGLLLLILSIRADQLHDSARYCIHLGSCEGLRSSS